MVDFLPFFKRDSTFVTFGLLFLKLPAPSEKVSTLQGKNLLELGTNSFL